MPELPEVETVCRGLATQLLGKRLARVELRRPDLRFPIPPELPAKLTGRRVESIRRRAKYIIMEFDEDVALLAHLGMSGRMTVSNGVPNEFLPHDHLILVAEDGVCVRFNDPRRFGMLDLLVRGEENKHRLLADIGPEPLDAAFTGAVLARAIEGKMTPIKAAILDQKIVAGVGNIYACEALFQAGLSPTRLAGSLTGAQANKLVAAIKDVLTRAIAVGGSSLRDHVQVSGELGYFQHAWAVYGKEGEPCPGCACKDGVRRMVQSNRSTFYCAKKQK
ncbi:MAG: bifunctional DNA-formamidopyrimidine glycosylase/DNA-(apurinic or apyrimidinic site) lyase [Elsteraceae bacterium]